MTEMGTAFAQQTGIAVKGEFGPSGLLRQRIEKGAAADVFASADMQHPRTLFQQGLGTGAMRFTSNRLCALSLSQAGLTSTNFLERALAPNTRLGTSTPLADPGGDYTWMMFDKAEKLHKGAAQQLKSKALQLVGGPSPAAVPKGQGALAYLVGSGATDIFIAYCTSGQAAHAQDARLAVVELPAALAQSADYGMTVVGKDPAAARFALFVLSEQGQAILARWGFGSPQPAHN